MWINYCELRTKTGCTTPRSAKDCQHQESATKIKTSKVRVQDQDQNRRVWDQDHESWFTTKTKLLVTKTKKVLVSRRIPWSWYHIPAFLRHRNVLVNGSWWILMLYTLFSTSSAEKTVIIRHSEVLNSAQITWSWFLPRDARSASAVLLS